MHRCPRCLTIVKDLDKFCDNCGLQLTETEENPSIDSGKRPASPLLSPGVCSACGYKNIPGEMFCENCGVQLAPVPSVPPPPPVRNTGFSPRRAKDVPAKEVSVSDVCPHCHNPIDIGSKFCQNCGAQLTGLETVPRKLAGEQLDFSEAQVSDLNQEDNFYLELPEADRITGTFVLRGTEDKIVLDPHKSEMLIGRTDITRDVFPEIDLAPFGGDKFGVSREHARLVVRGSQLYIQDMNSTNFTFINELRLKPGQYYLLKSGDEIRLGMLVLKFQVG